MLKLLDLLAYRVVGQDYTLLNTNGKVINLKDMDLDKTIKVLNSSVMKYNAEDSKLIIRVDTLDK